MLINTHPRPNIEDACKTQNSNSQTHVSTLVCWTNLRPFRASKSLASTSIALHRVLQCLALPFHRGRVCATPYIVGTTRWGEVKCSESWWGEQDLSSGFERKGVETSQEGNLFLGSSKSFSSLQNTPLLKFTSESRVYTNGESWTARARISWMKADSIDRDLPAFYLSSLCLHNIRTSELWLA